MPGLCNKTCGVCQVGAPQVTPEEMDTLMSQVPLWHLEDEKGAKCLQRTFNFKNFQSALDFTNQVGGIAEEEGHHPAITVEWGKVTVRWYTHKIQGLHENDFIMAAKTDALILC